MLTKRHIYIKTLVVEFTAACLKELYYDEAVTDDG